MFNVSNAKENLLKAAALLQEKRLLAETVGPDYFEPGNMENLEQYLGLFDENKNSITLRTEAKGLRYDERTPRLDQLAVGDPVQLVREPDNPYNSNNIMILSEQGESLGNLPAELCNVISPLLDLGYASLEHPQVSYLERIRERSRYAKQGVLFIEFRIALHGI